MNVDFAGTNKSRPSDDLDLAQASNSPCEDDDLSDLLGSLELKTASELADTIRAKPGLLDKILGG